MKYLVQKFTLCVTFILGISLPIILALLVHPYLLVLLFLFWIITPAFVVAKWDVINELEEKEREE